MSPNENDAKGSKIDDFFESIFGYRPKKKGKSYELIVAAALKHVGRTSEVRSDAYMRGVYSGENYQIDALVEASKKTFVEAKDYTDRDEKVGRPDVTKLAGALIDLPIQGGAVASATGFTRPAKKYADASKINPDSKPIDLYNIRPSVKEDEEGRIKTISITIHFLVKQFEKMQWEPIFTKDGFKMLQGLYKENERIQEPTYAYYRADGSVLIFVKELTASIQIGDNDHDVVAGEWKAQEPAFMKLKNHLVPIECVKYSIPVGRHTHQVVVEADGRACLLVESEDGEVNKLLTDVDLKKTTFDEDGHVIIEND